MWRQPLMQSSQVVIERWPSEQRIVWRPLGDSIRIASVPSGPIYSALNSLDPAYLARRTRNPICFRLRSASGRGKGFQPHLNDTQQTVLIWTLNLPVFWRKVADEHIDRAYGRQKKQAPLIIEDGTSSDNEYLEIIGGTSVSNHPILRSAAS